MKDNYNFRKELSQNICNTNCLQDWYRYNKSNFQYCKYTVTKNFGHLAESIMVPKKAVEHCTVLSRGSSFCPYIKSFLTSVLSQTRSSFPWQMSQRWFLMVSEHYISSKRACCIQATKLCRVYFFSQFENVFWTY